MGYAWLNKTLSSWVASQIKKVVNNSDDILDTSFVISNIKFNV